MMKLLQAREQSRGGFLLSADGYHAAVCNAACLWSYGEEARLRRSRALAVLKEESGSGKEMAVSLRDGFQTFQE